MKTSTMGLTAIEEKLLKLREETKELAQEIEGDTSPIALSEPSGASFWLIGAICAAAGLSAGLMLAGWII